MGGQKRSLASKQGSLWTLPWRPVFVDIRNIVLLVITVFVLTAAAMRNAITPRRHAEAEAYPNQGSNQSSDAAGATPPRILTQHVHQLGGASRSLDRSVLPTFCWWPQNLFWKRFGYKGSPIGCREVEFGWLRGQVSLWIEREGSTTHSESEAGDMGVNETACNKTRTCRLPKNACPPSTHE